MLFEGMNFGSNFISFKRFNKVSGFVLKISKFIAWLEHTSKVLNGPPKKLILTYLYQYVQLQA